MFGAGLMSGQIINAKVNTDLFPVAGKGMSKFVIEVPHSTIEEDNTKKVEIIVGKYTQTDKCNNHFMVGQLEKKDLKGYGYNYYEYKGDGSIAGTMKGCLDSGTMSKFVSAQPTLVDYNGRLPIVVYVPEGFDVQYRIYKAQPEQYKALQSLQGNKK